MTRFRTTEISDPDYESNDLRFITVKTPHLKGRGDICVYVPDMPDATDLPIVILLHGVYGSAWIWSQKAGAHLTAARLIAAGKITPMVLAMPSDGLWGDGSAYLPHHQFDFEQWIVSDVPDAVIENLPQVSDQSPVFISGLSMGGFGALRLGAKYHDRFSGISAHSSITHLDQMTLFIEELVENYRQASKTSESVWGTILENRHLLPPVRFDCGKDDLLISYNSDLHRKMEEAQIPHTYLEFPGKHEWSYWREHLEDTLLFFNGLLTT